MKFFLLTTISLIHLTATAQSPYLSILVKMDSIKADGTRYKIEMKICEPKKKTERGDWFSHDTSRINFSSLKKEEIDCGDYFDKGTPTLISGQEKESSMNEFEFSGQLYAWEHIFIFRIANMSSRGLTPDMYVVMPMKYKSFLTHIKLTDLEFQSGKVMFLSDYHASYTATQDKKFLNIDQSLKIYKTVDIKKNSLKEILEKK